MKEKKSFPKNKKKIRILQCKSLESSVKGIESGFRIKNPGEITEILYKEMDKKGNFVLKNGKKGKVTSIIYSDPRKRSDEVLAIYNFMNLNDEYRGDYIMSLEKYNEMGKPKEISIKQDIYYEINKIK